MVNEHTRIVVCDDSNAIRLGITRMLSSIGNFEVVSSARNGEEAVECAQMLRPDVVVMDVEMPSMNGIEATLRIKSDLPNTQVIMFTSADDDSTVFRALAAGADGYCTKSSPASLPSIITDARCKSFKVSGSPSGRSVSDIVKMLSL